jgi:Na+-transporting NADH:ubiquinone oxidoreductase subunit C
MPASNKDSIANTFITALVLCLVCSFLVSAAAVGLKARQVTNVELDRKKNILEVTGFTADDIDSAGGIEKLYDDRFETQVIVMDTGQDGLEELTAALKVAGKDLGDDVLGKYDQFWASRSKKASLSDQIDKTEDIASVKYREKFSHVFVLKDASGKAEKYVFPVRGYGLWSMMRGFLALEPDFKTVAGLTFYEQKETPGLGGEVQNPQWKKLWADKKVYNDAGEVELEVVKGAGTNEYEVDGLSGATITSKGVSNMDLVPTLSDKKLGRHRPR